jgi:hypothetical protein
MKRRKFARGDDVEGSDESSADTSPANEEPSKSRFSEDTYARARKSLESGSEEAPKAAPKAAPKKSRESTADLGMANEPAEMRRASSTKPGEIPGQASDVKAPASTGGGTSGPSNFGRIASALGAGAGIAGTAAALRTAGHADRLAGRVAKAIGSAKATDKVAAPTAQVAKDASKYTPKQQLEAGESSIRGALARKGMREERSKAEAGTPKGTSFMEKAASNKRGTSYKDDMKKGGAVKKYASGGSVSSRADGCAQRGHTRGTMV